MDQSMSPNNKKPRHYFRNARRRIYRAQILCVVIPLLTCAFFGNKYILQPMISSTESSKKNAITYEAIQTSVVEGDILDRNGDVILGYATAGESAYANNPENYSYAYLLGYYTVDFDSYTENTYGLRGNLKQYSLFHLDESNKGATVKLTTDNALQNYCYSLLNGQEGSITVIDNDTGAILALSSQSTIDYDVNDTGSFVSNTTQDGQYRRGTYENDPPGSTFKVITTIAALEKQRDENLSDEFFDYYDTGSYVAPDDGWTITNYNDQVYGQISLNDAFANSVNCYFANLGVSVGTEYLQEIADRFMIGTDIEIPYLCTLHSSFDLTDATAGDIAQTAFGQGTTEITPVHLAMIAQALSNDGAMLQPYIVESVSQGNRQFVKSSTKILSQTTEESIIERLKEAMHEAATTYGFDESTYGMVYAKTGTAECANNRTHCYMIGFTNSCSFCISFNNLDASYLLYDEALSLVNFLNTYGY